MALENVYIYHSNCNVLGRNFRNLKHVSSFDAHVTLGCTQSAVRKGRIVLQINERALLNYGIDCLVHWVLLIGGRRFVSSCIRWFTIFVLRRRWMDKRSSRVICKLLANPIQVHPPPPPFKAFDKFGLTPAQSHKEYLSFSCKLITKFRLN